MKKKENDAKVFYTILKLQNQVGEATPTLISRYTFPKPEVSRCLKRLEAEGWIARVKKPGQSGWKLYEVDEDEHVSLGDTARLVQSLMRYKGSDDHVLVNEFLKELRRNHGLEYLQTDGDIKGKIQFLIDLGYVQKVTPDGRIIRLHDKTLEQKLYIELLAADVDLSKLARYRFKGSIRRRKPKIIRWTGAKKPSAKKRKTGVRAK